LWIGEIFIGLEHMHHMDMLLRDLKIDNIVFSLDGTAKITDFGFGRVGSQSDGIWSFGMPTGTPGYCAPEILREEPYDNSADMYSFGVLVWVLLSGGITSLLAPQPPITRTSRASDYEALCHDWKQLAYCILNPESNRALRLPKIQQDFILRLTRGQRQSRLTAVDVREHPYMQPLQLPESSAAHAELLTWRKRMAANFPHERLEETNYNNSAQRTASEGPGRRNSREKEVHEEKNHEDKSGESRKRSCRPRRSASQPRASDKPHGTSVSRR